MRRYAILLLPRPTRLRHLRHAGDHGAGGSVLEQWGGAALGHLPPTMIAGEFVYNRFAPGPFGLSAKMGAEATIILPGMATAGPDTPGKAATLRLRTVNGNSFELPVKAS